MQTGNTQEVTKILQLFKNPNGSENFESLLLIPVTKRLPAMANADRQRATALCIIGLTKAFKAMNLSRPINESQILDLAETILESSNEDQLSLQDLLLFLQGLVRGKYGPLYESMDIPKFMEKFEVYRQVRHVEYLKIKETQHLQFKALGDSNRSTQQDPLSEAAYNMAGRMNELKTKLKQQRAINQKR